MSEKRGGEAVKGTLPKEWMTCRLADVTDIVMGQSPPSSTYNRKAIGLPFFQGKAEFGALFPTARIYCSKPKKVAREGAVLLSVRAPVGPVNLAPTLCSIGRGLAAIHPLGDMPSKFIFYFFRNHANELAKQATGTTFKAVNKKTVENIPFVLPPLNEQRRIVAKIEALFSELEAGVAALEAARTRLKRYRQALLKAAFEGRLTEDWRQAHRDALEPAETLLARIRAERERRWQAQLAEWQRAVAEWEVAGKPGRKPKKPRKPKELPPLTEEELAALPELTEGWAWVRLGSVIDEPKYGTSKKCSYQFKGIGVLRIPNIVNGIIDESDLKYASFDPTEIETYKLKAGDVLIIRSNGSVSLVGRAAYVSNKDTQYLFAGYLIRLRPATALFRGKYLQYVLSSPALREQIEAKAKSTSGVNNINSKELQMLSVPLCSSREQELIIARLENCFSTLDYLDQTIAQALEQAAALRQAILKKAFSGRLVPQNANDEPAGALLGRIRGEKERNVVTDKKTSRSHHP